MNKQHFLLLFPGLRIYNVDVTERLLDTVEVFLRNKTVNPFLLPERNAVRVISGEEEAVYAWVTANYLRGFFWSNRLVT